MAASLVHGDSHPLLLTSVEGTAEAGGDTGVSREAGVCSGQHLGSHGSRLLVPGRGVCEQSAAPPHLSPLWKWCLCADCAWVYGAPRICVCQRVSAALAHRVNRAPWICIHQGAGAAPVSIWGGKCVCPLAGVWILHCHASQGTTPGTPSACNCGLPCSVCGMLCWPRAHGHLALATVLHSRCALT